MDQLDHEIVQDLLPLYHENVCSERSRAAVEAHLKTCKDCRATLAVMDAPLPEAKKTPAQTPPRGGRATQQNSPAGDRKFYFKSGHAVDAPQNQSFFKIGFPIDAGEAEKLPLPPDIENIAVVHGRSPFLKISFRSFL